MGRKESNQTNKKEIGLASYRQILNICDLDLWLQGHSNDLKLLL